MAGSYVVIMPRPCVVLFFFSSSDAASFQNTTVQVDLQQQQQQTTVTDDKKEKTKQQLNAIVGGILLCVLAALGGCFTLSCAIPSFVFAIAVRYRINYMCVRGCNMSMNSGS